jgi:hypothetical protein
MKITKKDIMYLKWLALFLFVYVFWTFVWLPMSTKLETKQGELAELKTAQTIAQATIPTYDATIAQEIKIKNEATLLFSKFFDVQTPAQMEDYLIPILTDHKGRITYFEVADASVVIPQTTLQTKDQLTYKIKELVDQYNNITQPTTDLPVTESQLLKTQITYILDISFSEYRNLLETIDEMDISILLSSSSYNIEDASAEMTFDLYSLEKIIIE